MRAVIEAALVFSIVSPTRTQILNNEADVMKRSVALRIACASSMTRGDKNRGWLLKIEGG